MLADAGFDLEHAFDARALARDFAWLAGPEPRGLLVGNTRALWPRFVAAMRDPELRAERDPLDHYTERVIDAAFPGARIFYAHRAYDGGYLPFQRLAVATGLGALAPTQLVIHPSYGPWFALRAVVLTDGEPVARVPIPQPCRCDHRCRAAHEAARGRDDWRAWLAVRDACSLSAHRYSDDQIEFHGTKVWRG